MPIRIFWAIQNDLLHLAAYALREVTLWHMADIYCICLFVQAPGGYQWYTSESGGLSWHPSSPQTVNFNSMNKLTRVSPLGVFGACQKEGGAEGACKTADEGGFIAMGTRPPMGKGADLVSWGRGRQETRHYLSGFIFKIVCGMEMSPMHTRVWRGLGTILV